MYYFPNKNDGVTLNNGMEIFGGPTWIPRVSTSYRL